MSQFVVNQSCEMCKKIEKGLCRMSVGNTKHYICYDCMAGFVWDLAQFAEQNLHRELAKMGGKITSELIEKR